MSENSTSYEYWLENYHFLKINDGKLILWNYKSHEQFELDAEHLARLIEFSQGALLSNTALDQEIFGTGILLKNKPVSKWGWDWLAQIFHFGTCHPTSPTSGVTDELIAEYNKSYTEYCASIAHNEPEVEIIKGGKIYQLPPPDLNSFESVSFWETLTRRRTCRDFDSSSVNLSDISDMLFATFGDQRSPDPSTPKNVKVYGYRRTSPAAGGLQCTEPYLWAINVIGLPAGIYHYLSCKHQLEAIDGIKPEHPIGTYLCNQHWANDLAFAVIMTCRMDKMWWKYPHSRAYRPMLMDVGHLSQTLNMCITAKKLHPWITGYFHDKEIAELLSCDQEHEQPMLLVGAGRGLGSSFSRESTDQFKIMNSQ